MEPSKYQTILDDLIANIRKGDYRANDQLPSERILAEKYDVARATARRALTDLSEMGLVVRRGRNGTIVLPSVAGTSIETVNLICAAEPLASVSDFLRWSVQKCEAIGWVPKVTRVAVNDEAALLNALTLGMRNIFFATGFESGLSVKVQRALAKVADKTVLLAERLDDLGVTSIVGDDLKGTALAIAHLKACGHRKIALVAGGESIDHSILQLIHGEWKRQLEFMMSVQDFRDCLLQVQHRPFHDLALGAKEEVTDFLNSSRAEGVTALLCLYEEIAIGALSACREHGLSIPGDISIAGYAITQRSNLQSPHISGVSVRMDNHVSKAFSLLVKSINRSSRTKRVYRIEPEFREADSIGNV